MESISCFFLWLNCLHQKVSFCFSYCVFVGKKPGRDRQCYSRIYYINLQSTPVRKTDEHGLNGYFSDDP